jgi:hypothetical protein
MKVKFLGFKQAPIRDHIVVLADKKHHLIGVGEDVELTAAEGHRLIATGEFEEVEEAAPRKKNVEKAAGENRAILDPKPE